MGMISDTLRLRQLQGRKMDLQFKISEITSTKSSLVNAGDDLMKVGTDYDPDSPVMKTLQQRQAKIKIMEERLNQQMQEYQIQLEMVEAEYGQVRQRLSQEIKEEMSYSLA
jgi:hypothetical protein